MSVIFIGEQNSVFLWQKFEAETTTLYLFRKGPKWHVKAQGFSNCVYCRLFVHSNRQMRYLMIVNLRMKKAPCLRQMISNKRWVTVSGQKMTHRGREERETYRRHTQRESQNKSTRVRLRENKRKCGGESFSVIHSHSREWLQGRNKRAGPS